MKIALVSYEPEIKNTELNFKKASDLINTAKLKGANLCIFPESTMSGFIFPNNVHSEYYSNSPSLKFFRGKAVELEISLIFGLFIKDEISGGVKNSAVIINQIGEITLRYDKVHIFSPGKENEYNIAGNEIKMGTINENFFGISICYDLRFPEMFTKMAPYCDAIINIANWPSKRSPHWNALLRARAIENQLFMIGVNRYGYDPKGEFFAGDSLVFDPWGELIQAEFSSGAVSVYTLSFDKVAEIRKTFPILEDRRFKSELL
jgi:omega-amidase